MENVKLHKMVACDNPDSVGYQYLNAIGVLQHDGVGRSFLFSSMYSSTIKAIKQEDDLTTITTRNTIYIFKDVKD